MHLLCQSLEGRKNFFAFLVLSSFLVCITFRAGIAFSHYSCAILVQGKKKVRWDLEGAYSLLSLQRWKHCLWLLLRLNLPGFKSSHTYSSGALGACSVGSHSICYITIFLSQCISQLSTTTYHCSTLHALLKKQHYCYMLHAHAW